MARRKGVSSHLCLLNFLCSWASWQLRGQGVLANRAVVRVPALHRLLLTLASHRVVLSSEVKPSGAVQRVALGMQGAAKGWARSREVVDWVKSREDGGQVQCHHHFVPGA